MATQNQTINFDWVDVKSTLSLQDEQKYTFQNTGPFTIRIIEAASEPALNTYGHQLDANSLLSVTPTDGLNIYVRVVQKEGLKSNLTVTEAV